MTIRKIVGGLAVCLLLSSCSSTYLGRWATLRTPDVEDYRQLPSRPVANTPNAPALPQSLDPDWMRAMPFVYAGTRIDTPEKLDAALGSNGSTALIVIANGRVVDERYYRGYRRDSLYKCFSISKSVLSALFGIAQSEGVIGAQDRLDAHIDGIQNTKLAEVTLEQLLDNVSGLAYARGFAPWKQQPRMYYTTDVRGYVKAVEFAHSPGTHFEGEDLSPLLVAVALEHALKRKDPNATLSEYASRRLWQPMGAQYTALWNLDREGDGIEKAESGFVGRAIDFARFGQLYLDEGKANGRQLVPAEWVRASMTAPPKGSPNLFKEGFYRNLWWGSFRAHRLRDDVYANGHFGQRIYISPDKALVIVRMGSDSGDVNWTEFLGAIADGWKAPTQPINP